MTDFFRPAVAWFYELKTDFRLTFSQKRSYNLDVQILKQTIKLPEKHRFKYAVNEPEQVIFDVSCEHRARNFRVTS